MAPPASEPRWLATLTHPTAFPAAVFAMVAAALASQITHAAPPDMAFLLYAAGRVLDGATLYRDVVEINPPLIVWFNLPIEFTARALGVSDVLLYRLCTAGVVGGIFALCYHLVKRYVTPDDGRFGRFLLLLICFALFPLAAEDFGQREHFVLALLVPYMLLVAARLGGAWVPRRTAIWIGCLAGAAMALKPHFAIAWLALEIFLHVRGPEERTYATPQLVGALGFLVVYAILIVVVAPEYLPLAIALGPAYTRYLRESPFSLALLAPGAPLVLFTLLAMVVLRPYTRRRRLWALLGTVIVACYLSGLLQGKGFRYHFYPSFALAFVLLGLIALDAPSAGRRLSERLYAAVARANALTIVVVVTVAAVLEATGGYGEERHRADEATELAGFVRAHAGGKPVAVLSYNIASTFPLITEAGVPLASRFPHLWPFAVAYRDSAAAEAPLRYHAPSEMEPPERFLWDAVREDLLEQRPQLILVLRPARDVPRNGLRRLHYIQYFGRDSALASLFREYQLVAQKGEYDIYQRVPLGHFAAGPSSAPGRQDVNLPELQLRILDPLFVGGAVVFAIVLVALVTLGRRQRRGGDGMPLSPMGSGASGPAGR